MGMADANKRINLAAPLISVRRHGGEATPRAPPRPPQEHTGTVPFGWEHRPGHPKSVRTRRTPPPTTTVAPKEGPTSPSRFSDDVSCSATGLSDAMMERFLPAAHAVAVASPLSTFRKAGSVVRDPARAFNGDRRLPLQHIPTNHLKLKQLLLAPQDKNEDDDDGESDVHSTHGFASKRCGLLPTRCVKSTLLLLLNRGAALRGEGRSLVPSGSQRETNPLLRRSRSGQQQEQQQRHTEGGHDPDTQSWEELYIKSLLRSARGGLTAPAAAVASELDRTVRQLYRRRGGGAVQPKANHLGLLLVLDRSNDACRGETALLLPRAKSSPHAGKKPTRGDAGGYGFPLLLEDKAAASPSPGRETVLLPLPKSPSESWLSRALPSVSNRPPPATSFLGLHLHSRKHAPSCYLILLDSFGMFR